MALPDSERGTATSVKVIGSGHDRAKREQILIGYRILVLSFLVHVNFLCTRTRGLVIAHKKERSKAVDPGSIRDNLYYWSTLLGKTV